MIETWYFLYISLSNTIGYGKINVDFLFASSPLDRFGKLLLNVLDECLPFFYWRWYQMYGLTQLYFFYLLLLQSNEPDLINKKGNLTCCSPNATKPISA